MSSINWSAPNIWVFIAQLAEHCCANAEAMGSNLVEALKNFFGLKFAQVAITTAMVTSQFHQPILVAQINFFSKVNNSAN